MDGTFFTSFYFAFAIVSLLVNGQLIVNVKNKGGETIVEKILANTTTDTVSLEFLNSDGTFVTQFIDFKSEIQIFRLTVLGEEELGQGSEPQTVCFVSRFLRNDFISSDAMSKLRQKNPTAVRTPEEEKEALVLSLDLDVKLERGQVLSPHLQSVCSEASGGVYAMESDLRTLSKSLAKEYITLVSATKELPPSRYHRCRDVPSQTQPCTCQLKTCVGWYPCGLKYCHGRDGGRVVSYRCGIKTCKRCLAFVYVAKAKRNCLWDF